MTTPMALITSTAFLVLVLGTLYRLWKVLCTPVTREIPITPAAHSRFGVFVFLLIETLFFRTLFRASFWTWLFGALFHWCLLLTLIIHLRFIAIPAPAVAAWLLPYSSAIASGLVIGLLGLLARRLMVVRVRYVSSVSDYLHLVLLLVIALAGIGLAISQAANVYQVTLFVQGLLSGDWQPLGNHWLLVTHVLFACLIVCLYPFSKLFHGPLMWFNPTRSRPDRSRS